MRTFFKTHHALSSRDPLWADQYLRTRTLRVTYLLREEFGNEFWQNYSDVFHLFVKQEKLLFRSKVIRSDQVHFIQIWNSEKDAVDFESTANMGTKRPLEHLAKLGYKVEPHFCPHTYNECVELIQDIRRFPHLLQVVNRIFYTDGMVVGDPLKLNNGHLPFQHKDK